MIRKLVAEYLYRGARASLAFGRLGAGNARRLMRWAHLLCRDHAGAYAWHTYMEGLRNLELGMPENAIELLREAMRLLPDETDIRVNLGIAGTMAARYDEAVNAFESVIKDGLMPPHESAMSSLAWAYLCTGRAAKTREVVRQAEDAGIVTPTMNILGSFATAATGGKLSADEISTAIETHPQVLPMVLEHARMQVRDGRSGIAGEIIRALPEEEQLHGMLIIAFGSLNEGHTEGAKWAAGQISAQKREPNMDVGILQSEIALRTGNTEKALQHARKTLEQWPDSGRVHEQLGRVLIMDGRWDEATEEMIEALHTGKCGAMAAGVGAMAALEVGDIKSARGVFLASRSGDCVACLCSHTAMARLMIAENDPEEALKLAGWALEEARELEPWAQRTEFIKKISGTIRETLQQVAQNDDEDRQKRAQALLKQLDRIEQGYAKDE